MALLFLHTDDVRHAIKDNNTLCPFVILKGADQHAIPGTIYIRVVADTGNSRGVCLKTTYECYTSQKTGLSENGDKTINFAGKTAPRGASIYC